VPIEVPVYSDGETGVNLAPCHNLLSCVSLPEAKVSSYLGEANMLIV